MLSRAAVVTLAGLAVAACVRPHAELVHWDAGRQAGIARTPGNGRTYEVRGRRSAWALMEARCPNGPVEVAAEGFEPILRRVYPDWPGMPARGGPSDWRRYLWLFACGPPGAAAAAAPPARERGELRLRLDAPAETTRVVGTPLVEVRGQASGRGLAGHDVVIILDLSDSTLHTSGIDIDGDGPQGRTRPDLAAAIRAHTHDIAVLQRIQEEDFDDSVVMAVLTAAKVLIDRLDIGKDRVALVAFSSFAATPAPLGSSRRRLLDALRRLRVEFPRFLGPTNFEAALMRAGAELGTGSGRQRSVVFLSDGKPTTAFGEVVGAAGIRRAARWLADSGTRVYGFALGPEAMESLPLFREICEMTGGRALKMEKPGDVIVALHDLDLGDLAELHIENRSLGHAARGVSVSPTGIFDGFVDLAPGPNTLVVEARLRDGRTREVSRVVEYDPDTASPAEIARLKTSLRRRTLQLQLWDEMRRERRRQKRVLELDLDQDAARP